MTRCVVIPAFGAHDFFWGSAVPCFRSLRHHNPDIEVVLFYDQLDARQLDVFRDCECIRIGRGEFSVSHRTDLTEATYFKFHLDRLRHYDKALWLDTDTIVLGDITPLFVSDVPLAARFQAKPWSKEFVAPEIIFELHSLDASQKTLQGGVVCFDTAFWVREGILRQALDLGRRYGWAFFRNADQGILNILAHKYGNYGEYSADFNYCRYHDMIRGSASVEECDDGIARAREDSAPITVLHWNGRPKPYEILTGEHEARGNELRTLLCFEQFLHMDSKCENPGQQVRRRS